METLSRSSTSAPLLPKEERDQQRGQFLVNALPMLTKKEDDVAAGEQLRENARLAYEKLSEEKAALRNHT